jgi:hypothetical protein
MKAARISDARRARTLAVALAFLLGGTALYVKGVQAASCCTFTVDSAAAAIAPADADLHNAAASSTTYPRDSLGSPTLTVTAPASGREIVPAPSRGAAPTVTAWTSPGVTPSTRLTDFGT